jgi:hypothetical protein
MEEENVTLRNMPAQLICSSLMIKDLSKMIRLTRQHQAIPSIAIESETYGDLTELVNQAQD